MFLKQFCFKIVLILTIFHLFPFLVHSGVVSMKLVAGATLDFQIMSGRKYYRYSVSTITCIIV